MDQDLEEQGRNGSMLQAGHHLPEPARLLLNTTSSQPTSPERSPTGGQTRRLQSGSRPIPKPSGGNGAVARPIDWAALETAWQQEDPDQLERVLYQSLKPYSRSLKPIVNASFDLVGYERIGKLDHATKALLLSMANKINEPATREIIARAAGRCLQVTKARETDGMDLRLMVEIFCDELVEFPPDVAVHAFRKHARQEKWWPSLSEIRDQCQRATRWRRSLKKALE